MLGIIFAPVTDLLGVCKHLDDSERASTETMGKEINNEGFIGNYSVDFQSYQSLWLIQAGYEREDREVIATRSGLETKMIDDCIKFIQPKRHNVRDRQTQITSGAHHYTLKFRCIALVRHQD